MAHNCKSLIIHCIDFRFGSAIKNFLEKENLLDNCDIVAEAGAIKNLVSPEKESDKDFVFKQIDLSKKLHNIGEIILMNHTDCGAYGGRKSFLSHEEEIKKHSEDMESAKKMIQEKYPDIQIKTLLADINDSGEINIISSSI